MENSKRKKATSQEEKVAYIYSESNHPTMRTLTKAINARAYRIPKKPLHAITGPITALGLALQMPRYDTYILDSPLPIFVPVFRRLLLREECRVIYREISGLFEDETGDYIGTKNPLKRALLFYLIRHIDAALVETSMVERYAKRQIQVPTLVARSYVGGLEEVVKIKPGSDPKQFLFIGDYRPPSDHKGIRKLIGIFRELESKGIELQVVGGNMEELKENAPKNVHFHGYVQKKELHRFFKKCTFIIHLPLYESGPTAVLLSMGAGLIPLVNDRTGYQDIAQRVNNDLVTSQKEKKELAQWILKISQTPGEQRRRWSARSKDSVKELSIEKGTRVFVSNFNALVKKTSPR